MCGANASLLGTCVGKRQFSGSQITANVMDTTCNKILYWHKKFTGNNNMMQYPWQMALWWHASRHCAGHSSHPSLMYNDWGHMCTTFIKDTLLLFCGKWLVLILDSWFQDSGDLSSHPSLRLNPNFNPNPTLNPGKGGHVPRNLDFPWCQRAMFHFYWMASTWNHKQRQEVQ